MHIPEDPRERAAYGRGWDRGYWTAVAGLFVYLAVGMIRRLRQGQGRG